MDTKTAMANVEARAAVIQKVAALGAVANLREARGDASGSIQAQLCAYREYSQLLKLEAAYHEQ
jgi:hypothetical protein